MVPESVLVEEAIILCDLCRSANAEVRIFGGIAAAIVGEEWFTSNPRYARLPKDIDLVGRKEDLNILRGILAERGYSEEREVALQTEGERALFFRGDITIDFAGDVLPFCQRLDIRRRLALAFPTITLGDLVLEKLQIVEPKIGHLVDFLAITCSHRAEGLEQDYLAQVLGHRWAYWYSAKMFLGRVRTFIVTEGLRDAEVRVATVEALVEQIPKSIGWRVRSLFGTHLPWHGAVEPVDTVQRPF